MREFAIILPSAGASGRMRGVDKLLRAVRGEPLLRRAARRALSSGAHVVVTLPDYDHPRADALAGLAVQLVAVPDNGLGMSASLRRAVAHLPKGIKAAIIALPDMPDVTAQDYTALMDAFEAAPFPTLQRATTAEGVNGHPVLFPMDCFAALMHTSGDQGARDVVQANRHRLRQVTLPGQHAVLDLDTPEAWDQWEASQQALETL